MKANNIRWMSCLLLAILLVSGFTNDHVNAASAEIEIMADQQEVIVGDTVNVSVVISSVEKFSNFEANLIYTEDILEYEGQSSVITGDGGFIRIYDMNYPEGAIKRKYNMKFKVVKAGYSTIKFKDRAMVYSEEFDEEMSVASNQLTIKAVSKETSSENSLLGKLEVNPGTLNPSFDKNIDSYTMEVGYDVDRLIVYAISEDEKATVTVSGNENLQEGENTIIIGVSAESGAVKEYIIDVNKEVAPVDEVDQSEETGTVNHDNEFEIIEEDGKYHMVYQGNYEIVEPDSSVVIPEGYVKGSVTISNQKITAFYPEGNMDHDFILIYASNQLEEEGFYQFDRVERSLQRFVAVEVKEQVVEVIDETKDAIIRDYQIKLRNFGIAIGIISLIGVILIITNVFQFMKRKGLLK